MTSPAKRPWAPVAEVRDARYSVNRDQNFRLKVAAFQAGCAVGWPDAVLLVEVQNIFNCTEGNFQ
jgi:hypothetical protein